ncbi:MAG: asparaginase [Pseudomonadota bacterium]
MANPVIAEVTRGTRVESIHRGAIAVVDADGSVINAIGNIEALTFPRSSLKLMQALPLVESGAAEALGFTHRELAMACASHSSAQMHVETASEMLNRVGLTEKHLQCGAHWPVFRTQDAVTMALRGETPTRLHNNCSGKHASFLCTCSHLGVSTEDYIGPSNPLQREVRNIIETLCGTAISDDACGLDGCSAPTFAVAIKGMAQAHAMLATGSGVAVPHASAAKTLLEACMAEPEMVADHGRYCTRLMQAAPGRLFAKTGAEGFYVAAIPERGIGIALKCDDGATRAAEVAIAGTIANIIGEADPAYAAIHSLSMQAVSDWNGNVLGEVRQTLR